MSERPTSVEAYSSCRFYVQIDGITQAVFTELTGLQVETKYEEYEEGGNNGFVHKLPGRTKVENITLKRGMTPSNDLFKWYLDIVQGKIARKHITITMFDTKGQQLVKWDFQNAYPVKWVGPQFQADTTNVAIETLELAHDGLVIS